MPTDEADKTEMMGVLCWRRWDGAGREYVGDRPSICAESSLGHERLLLGKLHRKGVGATGNIHGVRGLRFRGFYRYRRCSSAVGGHREDAQAPALYGLIAI